MLVGLSTNKAFVAVKRNIVMSLATTMKVYKLKLQVTAVPTYSVKPVFG